MITSQSLPEGTHSLTEARIAETGSPHRLAFIEGLRACAALYVVLGHVVAFVDPSQLAGIKDHSAQWLQNLAFAFGFGHLAVAAFIVISGFCLRWASLQRAQNRSEPYQSFMLRRAKRILPPYYACLVLSIVVATTITPLAGKMPYTQYLPVTVQNVLAHLFLIHNFNPAWMYKINGVLWSIAIEFQIYFLFPLLALGLGNGKGAQKWVRVFVVLVFTALFSIVVITQVPRGMKLYPWFVGFFALGMVGADLVESGVSKLKPLLGIAILGGLGATLLTIHANALPIWQEMGLAVAVCLILVMGSSAQPSRMITQVFAFRPLALIGTFSYSLYLVHHPILQVVDYCARGLWGHPLRHLLVLGIVGVPIAVASAFLFSLVFEGRYVRRAIQDLLIDRDSVISIPVNPSEAS